AAAGGGGQGGGDQGGTHVVGHVARAGRERRPGRARQPGGPAMTTPAHGQPLYGVVAEFDSPTALVHAANRAREAGYTRMDGCSPFAIEGLHHALGVRSTRLPYLIFLGGLFGAVGGYLLQAYAAGAMAEWIRALGFPSVAAQTGYPLNIAGRP